MTRVEAPTPAPEAATDGLARDSELLVAALQAGVESPTGSSTCLYIELLLGQLRSG